MKKNTIEMVEESLENMRYEIKVEEHIIVKAKKSLDRMLQLK